MCGNVLTSSELHPQSTIPERSVLRDPIATVVVWWEDASTIDRPPGRGDAVCLLTTVRSGSFGLYVRLQGLELAVVRVAPYVPHWSEISQKGETPIQ